MKSILKKILLMIRPVVSCKISFGPESTEANVALVAATHCKKGFLVKLSNVVQLISVNYAI